jgi:hypothetical protein
MCVIKIHAFIYFLRPPPWYGTLCMAASVDTHYLASNFYVPVSSNSWSCTRYNKIVGSAAVLSCQHWRISSCTILWHSWYPITSRAIPTATWNWKEKHFQLIANKKDEQGKCKTDFDWSESKEYELKSASGNLKPASGVVTRRHPK